LGELQSEAFDDEDHFILLIYCTAEKLIEYGVDESDELVGGGV
jgi:hypothetical protein